MDTIFTTFLLFLAVITALLTYLIIPKLPVVTLATAASIALAAGVWWHWSQFAIEYKRSTWQEQLRNYASYALLLVVILLSYAFYVFAWKGSSLQDFAAKAQSSIRNVGRKTLTQISSGVSKAASATQSALFSEPSEAPVAANVRSNTFGRTSSNTTRSGNILA